MDESLHQSRGETLDPAVRALGLAPFTPHNFRDTAASLAVSAGANVKAVQRMLGHASAAMTLDVYSGRFADDLDRVAEQLHEAAVDQRLVANAVPTASVARRRLH